MRLVFSLLLASTLTYGEDVPLTFFETIPSNCSWEHRPLIDAKCSEACAFTTSSHIIRICADDCIKSFGDQESCRCHSQCVNNREENACHTRCNQFHQTNDQYRICQRGCFHQDNTPFKIEKCLNNCDLKTIPTFSNLNDFNNIKVKLDELQQKFVRLLENEMKLAKTPGTVVIASTIILMETTTLLPDTTKITTIAPKTTTTTVLPTTTAEPLNQTAICLERCDSWKPSLRWVCRMECIQDDFISNRKDNGEEMTCDERCVAQTEKDKILCKYLCAVLKNVTAIDNVCKEDCKQSNSTSCFQDCFDSSSSPKQIVKRDLNTICNHVCSEAETDAERDTCLLTCNLGKHIGPCKGECAESENVDQCWRGCILKRGGPKLGDDTNKNCEFCKEDTYFGRMVCKIYCKQSSTATQLSTEQIMEELETVNSIIIKNWYNHKQRPNSLEDSTNTELLESIDCKKSCSNKFAITKMVCMLICEPIDGEYKKLFESELTCTEACKGQGMLGGSSLCNIYCKLTKLAVESGKLETRTNCDEILSRKENCYLPYDQECIKKLEQCLSKEPSTDSKPSYLDFEMIGQACMRSCNEKNSQCTTDGCPERKECILKCIELAVHQVTGGYCDGYPGCRYRTKDVVDCFLGSCRNQMGSIIEIKLPTVKSNMRIFEAHDHDIARISNPEFADIQNFCFIYCATLKVTSCVLSCVENSIIQHYFYKGINCVGQVYCFPDNGNTVIRCRIDFNFCVRVTEAKSFWRADSELSRKQLRQIGYNCSHQCENMTYGYSDCSDWCPEKADCTLKCIDNKIENYMGNCDNSKCQYFNYKLVKCSFYDCPKDEQQLYSIELPILSNANRYNTDMFSSSRSQKGIKQKLVLDRCQRLCKKSQMEHCLIDCTKERLVKRMSRLNDENYIKDFSDLNNCFENCYKGFSDIKSSLSRCKQNIQLPEMSFKTKRAALSRSKRSKVFCDEEKCCYKNICCKRGTTECWNTETLLKFKPPLP